MELSFYRTSVREQRVPSCPEIRCCKWCSIGLAVGLTGVQIDACTFNKPSLGSKLEAKIELKIRECCVKESEKFLLNACERIPQPIVGSVL